MSVGRMVLAAFVSPAAAAALVAAGALLLLLGGDNVRLREVAVVSGAAALIAFVLVVAYGIPMHILLRRLGRNGLLAHLVASLGPVAVFAATASHGEVIPFVVLSACSLAVAATFWVVSRRRGTLKPAVQPTPPLRGSAVEPRR